MVSEGGTLPPADTCYSLTAGWDLGVSRLPVFLHCAHTSNLGSLGCELNVLFTAVLSTLLVKVLDNSCISKLRLSTMCNGESCHCQVEDIKDTRVQRNSPA